MSNQPVDTAKSFVLSVEQRGAEDMQRLLGDISTPAILHDALHEAALKLRTAVQQRSPRYKPMIGEVLDHPPGQLKQSWTFPVEESPLLFSFGTSLSYARTLEDGTYPQRMVVATRRDGTPGNLVRSEGRVYSKHAVGGIVGPLMTRFRESGELEELVAWRLRMAVSGRAQRG